MIILVKGNDRKKFCSKFDPSWTVFSIEEGARLYPQEMNRFMIYKGLSGVGFCLSII